jgi:hypothetical protein
VRELLAGFGLVRRSHGVVFLLLAQNLALAAVLAVPLAVGLERDLRGTDAAARMTEGFDHAFWETWSERQTGPGRDLGPEILGAGFVARNLDLLLRGYLPAGIFSGLASSGLPRPEGRPVAPDPTVLALGAVFLLAQSFFSGGVLGVLRAPQGEWTLRGFLHGSGFYFGRMIRVSTIALALAGLVFASWAPLSRVAEVMARESVSEKGALGWSFGRFGALLLGLLYVHVLSSFAKVILVTEERRSALLAFLTAFFFSLRELPRVVVQYLAVLVLAIGLAGLWILFDQAFEPTGWRTQAFFLLAAQAFMAARISLRLSLLGGQLALYRGRGARAAAPAFVGGSGMR